MDKQAFYIKESLKLFLKFGVKSVTVGQITQHLNISSKTLYNIFEDKSGLVSECFQLYNHNTQKEYNQLIEASENVADAIIRFYNRLIESNARINPNFYIDIARYFPALWDRDYVYGIQQTEELLRRGIEEDIFVKGIEVPLVATTLTMLIRSMFEHDGYEAYHHQSQKMLSNVLWPYIRGICTPNGLTQFRKYRRHTVGV